MHAADGQYGAICGRRTGRGRRLRRLVLLVLLMGARLWAQDNSPDAVRLLAEADRLAMLNNWHKARPLFADAERLFAAAGDERNALYCKISRLRADVQSMSFIEVAEYLDRELSNPLVQADAKLRLRLLVVKGNIDLEIDPPSSRRDWEEVLAIAQSLKDKRWESRAKGELGVVAFVEGDSAKAKDLVAGALIYALASADVAAQIRYLTLVGEGMLELDRPEDALRYLDQALAIAATNPDLSFPMLTHAGKATALVRLNRRADALKALDEALARARKDQIADYEAELLVQLGILHAKANERTEAVQDFEDAAGIAGRERVYRIQASALMELAKEHRESGDLAKAQEAAVQSLAAIRKVGDRYSIPHQLALLADIVASRGRLREADALYIEATDIIEGMLVNAPSLAAKRSMVAAMSEVYIGHFKMATDRSRDTAKAFEIIERARGRTASDLLRSRPGSERKASGPPTAIERQISSLQIALLRTENAKQRQHLLDDLFAAEQRLAVPASGKTTSAVRLRAQPVRLATLQKALRPDEIMLEYVLTDPRSYCLTITNESAAIVQLARGVDIERDVIEHLKEIRARGNGRISGHRLYTALVAPIPLVGRKLRVIVVADGALHGISFDSLVDERGTYLVERHVISYAPSGTALHLLRTHPADQAADMSALIVGGVNYDQDASETRQPGEIQDETARSLSELRLASLKTIPHTLDEAQAVATVTGNKSVLLIGTAATETAFKAQPLKRFRILHLAVHGVSDKNYPDRAALVLGLDPRSPDDGLLQAREIAALDLNASLVVLSACDTGIGRVEGEEGTANLVQAFFIAGARSVVASQWAADDASTAALMKTFYQGLAKGQDKAMALREAKRSLMARFGADAVPYYWAGFILMGDSFPPLEFN